MSNLFLNEQQILNEEHATNEQHAFNFFNMKETMEKENQNNLMIMIQSVMLPMNLTTKFLHTCAINSRKNMIKQVMKTSGTQKAQKHYRRNRCLHAH